MSKPLIVYWSSNSGGTKRAAEALDTDTVELAGYDGASPYVLACPTYDQPRGGFTPKPVQQFLEDHAHLMVGVLGLGNRNFGESIAKPRTTYRNSLTFRSCGVSR